GHASRGCTLLSGARARQGPCGHLTLARVGQLARRLLQRHPARVLDLEIVVVDLALAVGEEEEPGDLRDPLPLAGVPVAHVAERLDEPRYDAGLLAHLA